MRPPPAMRAVQRSREHQHLAAGTGRGKTARAPKPDNLRTAACPFDALLNRADSAIWRLEVVPEQGFWSLRVLR
jgi:hypothetical protein